MFLERIGADARIRGLFAPHEAVDIELGRVSFASHDLYRIYLDTGECEAALVGRLRWSGLQCAVGDWVAARRVDPELALIEAVLPRHSQFVRRAAGSVTVEQVIAANIDLVLVVCALDAGFNLRRLERYLLLASESGSEPVLVLNKADLCPDLDAKAQAVRQIAPQARVLMLSARENVEPLRVVVQGRTAALLGSSGAGKSTIANGLLLEERQATGAVRESDSRGRHVTTGRMLFPLPGGGAIIDNPGMRELQLWAGREALDDVFHEVSELARECRFRDCTHSSEPGCAVRTALENGGLDLRRWNSYLKLAAELRHLETEQDARSRIAERNRWKAIHRSLRDHPKYQR